MRMKQLWALLLALSLLCSLTLPALAEDGTDAEDAVLESFVAPSALSPEDFGGFPGGDLPIIDIPEIDIDGDHFPDQVFRAYVSEVVDQENGDGNGSLSGDELESVTRIDCSDAGISSLAGVELFPNLQVLNCSFNDLTSIDLSGNTALKVLYLVGNEGLSSLDVTMIPALVGLLENAERWEEDEGDLAYAGYASDPAELVIPMGTSLVGYPTVHFDLGDSSSDPFDYPAITVRAGSAAFWLDDLDAPLFEDGSVFSGWTTLDGEAFTAESIITQDVTLLAQSELACTVTLNCGDGAINGESEYTIQSYVGSTLYADSLPVPTLAGKAFTGWLLNGGSFTELTLTGDVTLTASWVDGYTLHFDRSNPHDDQKALDDIVVVAGGTVEVGFAYMDYDTVLPPLLNDDKVNGYQFIGWDTDPNAAIGAVQFPRWTAASPTGLKGPYSVTLSEETPTVTLYAIYAKLPTVTVHKNDGTDTIMNNTIITRGAFYTYLWIGGNNFTRDGFDLIGYSTDPNATAPDAGLEKPSVNNTPAVYYPATEDVDLYAVWGPKRYVIRFDANGGGQLKLDNILFSREDEKEIVLPTAEELNISKAHRVFLGWYVDNPYPDQNCDRVPSGVHPGGTVLTTADLNASDHTLYAIWQYEAVTVSLDFNGYQGSDPSYPKAYNYGASGNPNSGGPTTNPCTPRSYNYDKGFPAVAEHASGATNKIICWQDKATEVFYPNGSVTNYDNHSAWLSNERDTELLAIWNHSFVSYLDPNGEVTKVDTVTGTYTDNRFDHNTLTVRSPEERAGYDFLGWATEENGEVVYRPGDTIDTLAEISFYPVYQLNATTVVLRSASVVFDGLIRLRYYFTLPDPLLDAGDSYLVFYKRGEEMNRTALKDGTPVNKSGDPSNKSFDLSVVAKAFDDEIVIKILDTDGNAYPMVTENGADYTEIGFPYSVRQYAEYLQDNSSSATMQALAKALVEYGDAARIYFGGSGTVSEDVAAVTLDDFDGCAVKKSGVLPAGVTGKSISVMFEADNSLRIYLDFAPEYSPDDYSFTIDGEPATMQENADHKFYLTVGNIAAKNLDVFHTFTVSDGVRSFSIEASVLSYARLLVSGNKPNSQNLGKAMYLYNLAADAHFSNEALNADA